MLSGSYCQNRFLLAPAFFCLLGGVPTCRAFQINISGSSALHQQPYLHLQTSTTLCNHPRGDRRQFLKQLSTAFIGTSASSLVLPSLAAADEDVSDKEVDELAVETSNDNRSNKEVETVPAVETAIVENESDAIKEEKIEKVETIMKDEVELDAEVLREEMDEKKSISDEEELIIELEKEIAIEESDSSTPEEVLQEELKVRDETDAFIKEEEQLKSETEELIVKIETIESEVKSLDAKGEDTPTTTIEEGKDPTTTTSTETTPSEAFVDKLKERVEEKEDLITRLKLKSQKDIDPKTGKFRVMNQKEYKERAKSSDSDLVRFLKETVANEKEWERDVEAFEGLLEKKFGPAVKEINKDLKPIVGEVKKDLGPLVEEAEKELLKEVKPAENALRRFEEGVEAAVEGELEDIEKKADEFLGRTRSVF